MKRRSGLRKQCFKLDLYKNKPPGLLSVKHNITAHTISIFLLEQCNLIIKVAEELKHPNITHNLFHIISFFKVLKYTDIG